MDEASELLAAVRPLVDRIGATMIAADDVTDADVPLTWRGALVAGVRLTTDEEARPDEGGLTGILADVQREFDAPLTELARPEKQRAVRLLEEAGAFSYRKSVESVAAALGVSRFTVYNYLNRDRD
ncbi:MAG TPA: helix-turn-helix domain-containing protein [Microlunatus sp.]